MVLQLVAVHHDIPECEQKQYGGNMINDFRALRDQVYPDDDENERPQAPDILGIPPKFNDLKFFQQQQGTQQNKESSPKNTAGIRVFRGCHYSGFALSSLPGEAGGGKVDEGDGSPDPDSVDAAGGGKVDDGGCAEVAGEASGGPTEPGEAGGGPDVAGAVSGGAASGGAEAVGGGPEEACFREADVTINMPTMIKTTGQILLKLNQ